MRHAARRITYCCCKWYVFNRLGHDGAPNGAVHWGATHLFPIISQHTALRARSGACPGPALSSSHDMHAGKQAWSPKSKIQIPPHSPRRKMCWSHTCASQEYVLQCARCPSLLGTSLTASQLLSLPVACVVGVVAGSWQRRCCCFELGVPHL